MELNIEDQMQMNNVLRQRNFFAGVAALVVIANFLLILKLTSNAEKIIMVPGISRELTVEGSVVSQSYLEEWTLFFASTFLDLTKSTIELKKNIILNHASARSAGNIKTLQKYFAEKEEEHKKFDLSTSFSPEKMHTDAKNLQVVIEGKLISTFGKKGSETAEVKYLINYDFIGGYLKIKNFSQIKNREQNDAEQLKAELVP